MARKLRIEFAGALYHVMNRGDRREPIFKDDADRELFLDTLWRRPVEFLLEWPSRRSRYRVNAGLNAAMPLALGKGPAAARAGGGTPLPLCGFFRMTRKENPGLSAGWVNFGEHKRVNFPERRRFALAGCWYLALMLRPEQDGLLLGAFNLDALGFDRGIVFERLVDDAAVKGV